MRCSNAGASCHPLTSQVDAIGLFAAPDRAGRSQIWRSGPF